MKNLLFLLLALSCSFLSLGQYVAGALDKIISTYSEEKLLIESSMLLEEGYYASAEKIVDKLLQYGPDNSNYNYRKGFVLAEGRTDFAGAIPYLEKAVKNVDKNYDMYSGKETGAAVDALYRLGKCYHRTGNFAKAEEHYNAFLAQASKDTDLTAAAELGLTQLENARKLKENPKKNVEVVNLGSVINSPFPDYSPVVSFDGSALYYTSRRQWPEGQSEEFRDPRYDVFPEDIYVSYKDFDDTWAEPARLEFCTADQNEASISVSMDEKRIYVYQDIVGNGDLFYSDFSTNRFRDVQHVDNAGVNTKFWETHCTTTPDGRTMYFTSERPEGYGGRDIYRIVKLPDGTWSEPFNLGPMINSAFDEDAPFMASDNRTLYFASNGPKSTGGFDIMVSVIDGDNNWSEPINLGYPMNSPGDDLYYTETTDGRRGYITSIREDSRGEKDIYEIRNDYLTNKRGAILKGKIITLNERPLPEDITITLACTDCGSPMDRTVYPRNRDGLFMINLEPCHEYEVIFRHDDGKEEFHRETLKTDCSKELDEIYREIYLDADRLAIVDKPKTDSVPDVVVVTDPDPTVKPVKTFQDLQVKHYFGYNLNKVPTSNGDLKSFLASVTKQLQDGRGTVVVQIFSSASYVPTQKFKDNQELSRTRADNMKAELERYFAKNHKGRVQVEVISVVVSGPEYSGDAENTEKYRPYQYVELKTK